MRQLEEEDIRDSLRSEADRLREVRPLHLPSLAAPDGPRRTLRGSVARWQRPWHAPVMAAAVIVLVAAALVTAKVMRNGSVVPAPGPGPTAATPAGSAVADFTPRYYVRFGWATAPSETPSQGNNVIMVADVQTGKTLGSYDLPKGDTIVWEASGAADDRTFVVSASVFQSAQHPVLGPARFYLVRIFPGAADPVQVTPLALQATPATSVDTQVTSIALSGDGSELAVVFNAGKSVGLEVYSVASGQLQHSWSAASSGVPRQNTPVTDPSWAGDGTVGFAFIQTPNVRQEVRTLDISSGGTGLLADSRVVWSQYVPPPAGGKYGKGTPQACDTPFLTGDGQAVVCATSSYSASTKRLSAVWLAYPLATPTRPRVIGSVQVAQDVKGFNGPNAVEWVNSSGTEVIGSWNPETVVYSKNFQGPATSVTNDNAFIGGGKVREFLRITGPRGAAW
jgi:hypothetical protein